MGEGLPSDATGNLESALFYLGRAPEALAHCLRVLLPPKVQHELVRSAGRRKPGALDDALLLAEGLLQNPRLRKATLEAIQAHLPEGDAPPSELCRADSARHLRRDALLAALRESLYGSKETDWAQVAAHLLEWKDVLLEAEDPPEPKSATPDSEPAASPVRQPALDQELTTLRARLEEAKREQSALAMRAGKSNQKIERLEQSLADARATAEEERRRATELKHRLADVTSPDEREAGLQAEAEDARKQLRVIQQKFGFLQEEVEDLHGVLDDMDQYLLLPAEEIASFRNRPLVNEEQVLADQLAERQQLGRTPFRVLVVGGGEPQYRHRDKLQEYAEVLGFEAYWRMAEYSSWHKEMDRLTRDMKSRFDALIVLHWNRTTFTRKAREICNESGQKPCLTCHYEGFTSLRQTLQECIRQLLRA